MRIYLDDPHVGEKEKEYLNRAIDSTYVSTNGPFVAEFESKFAAFVHAPHAVSTQSGTAAIHMALVEYGIGPGDEVIVPALSFIASVNPVKYVGANPVLIDVDLQTWTLSPESFENAISEKTKAVIPVHLYGVPCDMSPILEIAQRHNIKVIEDATESLGASYHSQFTGTLGDLGCFSFNGNKTMTTGGGGMVVGSDARRISHIKFLVNQARDESRGYYHPEVGYNYRMTNIEASLGLAQLEQCSGFLQQKQRWHAIYDEQFRGNPRMILQQAYPDSVSSNWLNCLRIPGIDINNFAQRLRDDGIPCRHVFMPMTEFPPYKDSGRGSLDNCYTIYNEGICLPSSTLNTDDGIEQVCATVKRLLA